MNESRISELTELVRPLTSLDLAGSADIEPVNSFLDAIQARDSLAEAPQFRKVAAALQRDPLIGPQLDRVYGTALVGMRLEVDDLVHKVIRALAEDDAGDPDQSLRAVAAALSDAFDEADVAVDLVVPLFGFHSEGGAFGLAPGIRLDLLHSAELSLLNRGGHMPGRWRDSQFVWCLRLTIRLPKRLSDEETITVEKWEPWSSARARLATAIDALRVFQEGTFYSELSISSPGGLLFPADSLLGAAPPWYYDGEYRLSAEGVGELVSFYSAFMEIDLDERSQLRIAFRRFRDSSLRERDEDSIIDLMIAAEALFTKDSNSEMTFRLSTRAARFLGVDAADRHIAYQLFKRAYDRRSKIVHGVEVPIDEELLDQLSERMRAAIKRVTFDISDGTAPPGDIADWDALLLDPDPPA